METLHFSVMLLKSWLDCNRLVNNWICKMTSGQVKHSPDMSSQRRPIGLNSFVTEVLVVGCICRYLAVYIYSVRN